MLENKKLIMKQSIKRMRKNSIFFLPLMTLFILHINCNKSTGFTNSVFIAEAVSSKIVPLKIENGVGTGNLTISSAYTVNGNVKVDFAVQGADYLNEYNTANNTSYSLLSDSAYTLSASSVTIPTGNALSNVLTVSIDVTKWSAYQTGKLYVIPVKIVRADNGIATIGGADIALIQLNAVINLTTAQIGNSPGKRWSDGFNVPASVFTDAATGGPHNTYTLEGRFMCAGIFDGNGEGNMWQNVVFAEPATWFHLVSNGKLQPNSGPVSSLVEKVTLGQWYHFAIVHEAGSITYYINGTPILTSSYAPRTGTGDFGHSSGSAKLTLAEYRVWRTARSRNQINNFMCAVDSTDKDLVAYWPLNPNAPGGVLRDVSGNNNHLTLGTDNLSKITPVSGVRCPGN